MIELLLFRDRLQEGDLGRWALRSLVGAPLLGIGPGLAWGAWAFGPVGGDVQAGLVVGVALGIVLGMLASQGFGWGTVRAPLAHFCLTIAVAVSASFTVITFAPNLRRALSPTFQGALVPVAVVIWIGALVLLGNRWNPPAPTAQTPSDRGDLGSR